MSVSWSWDDATRQATWGRDSRGEYTPHQARPLGQLTILSFPTPTTAPWHSRTAASAEISINCGAAVGLMLQPGQVGPSATFHVDLGLGVFSSRRNRESSFDQRQALFGSRQLKFINQRSLGSSLATNTI